MGLLKGNMISGLGKLKIDFLKLNYFVCFLKSSAFSKQFK